MNTSPTTVPTGLRATGRGGTLSTEEIRFRIAAMFARDEDPSAFGAPAVRPERIR
ncbi:hypothetical protein [Rhodococcus spelaei]|uniref:hypothetical protein n=1 Tax=Rhodococcus spelaei TaxID=2546320 RepID=UPI0015EE5631|nr:hypothetical protein [Rhodococcus spelaei]